MNSGTIIPVPRSSISPMQSDISACMLAKWTSKWCVFVLYRLTDNWIVTILLKISVLRNFNCQTTPSSRHKLLLTARSEQHYRQDTLSTGVTDRQHWQATLTGNRHDRAAYRKACRVANKAITASRRNQYAEKIRSSGSDSRKRWSAIRDVLHSSGTVDVQAGDRTLCQTFAAFFHKQDPIR